MPKDITKEDLLSNSKAIRKKLRQLDENIRTKDLDTKMRSKILKRQRIIRDALLKK